MPGEGSDGTGFRIKNQSSKHMVGSQGTGGAVKGSAVSGVSNPRGIEPQKIGGGRMPLSQGPVQENVARKPTARKG